MSEIDPVAEMLPTQTESLGRVPIGSLEDLGRLELDDATSVPLSLVKFDFRFPQGRGQQPVSVPCRAVVPGLRAGGTREYDFVEVIRSTVGEGWTDSVVVTKNGRPYAGKIIKSPDLI